MSPNKTLYIRDTDMSVWEQAEEMATAAGQSVSQLATQALRAQLLLQNDHLIRVVEKLDDRSMEPGEAQLVYEGRVDASNPLTSFWRLWYPTDDGGADEHTIGGTERDRGQVIQEARAFLRDRARGEMQQITVQTGHDYERTEGFTGRWLVAPDSEETRTGEEGWDAGTYWGIALTKKDQIAVYTAHCNEKQPGRLKAYRSLEQAEGDVPEDILALASDALGIKRVVWRDI